MINQRRRKFMQSSLAVATVSATSGSQAGTNASEVIRIGLIGNGGRATTLKVELGKYPNVAITAIAEVNKTRKQDQGVNHVDDLREILDDPDIDAVVIATPDHWHAPAAIMGCQAGWGTHSGMEVVLHHQQS